MSSPNLTVVARIKARAGQGEAVHAILSKLPTPTRQETGCVRYDLHRCNDDASLFLFFETWRSKEDLDRHLKSAHVTEALTQVGPLLAETPEITLWTQIA